MSGQEDLELIVKKLEELSRQVHEENLSLDERVAFVSEASQLYLRFRESFEKGAFALHLIQRGPEGKLEEHKMDWKTIE